MGVIHKLRDDVVDFILAQKKARPEMSVRKLSAVVLKEFQIVVSKSSIGNVLKNANLNSPIGRHGFSADEEAGSLKKLAGKFAIPEHKKKHIFPSQQPAEKKQLSPPLKTIKKENASPAKISLPKEIKDEIMVKPLPIKREEEKPLAGMSNLALPQKSFPESIKNAGMIFLKAAEWDFAGGSVLAKVLKEELGGRFDINYDALADLLLFPELFDQQVLENSDDSGIEKLFCDSGKDDHSYSQEYSLAIAAAHQVDHCGLKLSVEMAIVMRGVAVIKVVDRKGTPIFYSSRNQEIGFANVQSADSQEVSVTEAVRHFNLDIGKNVHSAVFHYFAKDHNIIALLRFLLAAFGTSFGKHKNCGEGFKEVIFRDSEETELLKETYFSHKLRAFVVADWGWKDRWPTLNDAAAKADFKAISVLGRTFYYQSTDSDGLFDHKLEGLGAIIISSVPDGQEEPLVVLLTNSVGDKDLTEQKVREFLYSWPGFGEDGGPVSVMTNTWKKDVFANITKTLESESTLQQSLPRLRKIFELWAQHAFFSGKDNSSDEETNWEYIYSLPGQLRYESENAVVLTLEVPSSYDFLEELKGAIRRFNARMFRDIAGRRIFLKVTAHF